MIHFFKTSALKALLNDQYFFLRNFAFFAQIWKNGLALAVVNILIFNLNLIFIVMSAMHDEQCQTTLLNQINEIGRDLLRFI